MSFVEFPKVSRIYSFKQERKQKIYYIVISILRRKKCTTVIHIQAK